MLVGGSEPGGGIDGSKAGPIACPFWEASYGAATLGSGCGAIGSSALWSDTVWALGSGSVSEHGQSKD